MRCGVGALCFALLILIQQRPGGAGFGYSLYTIFSRAALQRGYTTSTINFYSCFFASLGVLLIWQPQGQVFAALSRPEAWIWCAVFAAAHLEGPIPFERNYINSVDSSDATNARLWFSSKARITSPRNSTGKI